MSRGAWRFLGSGTRRSRLFPGTQIRVGGYGFILERFSYTVIGVIGEEEGRIRASDGLGM